MTKRSESINAGLRIDPNSADCLTLRGYLFLTTGEFSKSIADDSKSISLGNSEAEQQYPQRPPTGRGGLTLSSGRSAKQSFFQNPEGHFGKLCLVRHRTDVTPYRI